MEMIGGYRVEDLIGRGGMGEVYRAYDTRRDRVVALKLLPPALSDDHAYRDRFERESRIAARLREPHIIPIHDFGEIDGRLFLDMRLVDGEDLESILRRRPLTPANGVEVVRQVASALDAAHAGGLVHRDVKPSNVLLTDHTEQRPGFAYLVDFGIARSATTDGSSATTRTDGMVGSVGYMAPERIADGRSEPRGDVYSLACVLYECLAGRPPFVGDSYQVMYAHVHGDPTPLTDLVEDLPAGLVDVVARGMAKDPADRYESAGAFASAAAEALTGAGGPTRPEGTAALALAATTQHTGDVGPSARTDPMPPTRPRRRRRRVLLAAVAAAVVVAGGVTAFVLTREPADTLPISQVDPFVRESGLTGIDAAATYAISAAPSMLSKTITLTNTRATAAKVAWFEVVPAEIAAKPDVTVRPGAQFVEDSPVLSWLCDLDAQQTVTLRWETALPSSASPDSDYLHTVVDLVATATRDQATAITKKAKELAGSGYEATTPESGQLTGSPSGSAVAGGTVVPKPSTSPPAATTTSGGTDPGGTGSGGGSGGSGGSDPGGGGAGGAPVTVDHAPELSFDQPARTDENTGVNLPVNVTDPDNDP